MQYLQKIWSLSRTKIENIEYNISNINKILKNILKSSLITGLKKSGPHEDPCGRNINNFLIDV